MPSALRAARASFTRFRRTHLPFLPKGEQIRATRNRLLRRAGFGRVYEPMRFTTDKACRHDGLLSIVAAARSLSAGEFRFLQIGAYDGDDDVLDTVESLSAAGVPVRGVLVEPQPTAVAALESRYADRPGVTVVNAAIDDTPGERPFYTVKGGAAVFASFDRDHLLKHGIVPSEVESTPVRCLTIAGVLAEAGLDTVDLIQIDAEGYDYEILSSIDLDRMTPPLIRFEYRHIAPAKLEEALDRLRRHGYRFLTEELDLIAIHDTAFGGRMARTAAAA